MRTTVVVTGFGPFLDHADNPSAALAKALDGRKLAGLRFVARAPLPVTYAQAAAQALEASRGAAALVAIGLAAGAERPRLEARAHNRVTAPHPDARGAVLAGRPIVPGAPASLRATLPLEPVARALAAAGIASRRSEDAGGYVCNDLYYRVLHAGRRALFLHVPKDVAPRRVAPALALGIAAAVGSAR